MRISELALQSGVSVATIKYYLREGLLQAGRPTAKTQAEYGREHLDRLRLVRALAEVGRLPLSTVRAVITALDSSGGIEPRELGQVIGTVYAALPPQLPERGDGPPGRAMAAIEALGWHIGPDSAALLQLDAALASVDAVGLAPSEQTLRVYGQAALEVAIRDIESLPGSGPAEILHHIVAGTLLYEPILTALRRLAMQHVYVSRHPDEFTP